MKNKWNFRISNDWCMGYHDSLFIHIEVLSFHWEDSYKWITVLGFSFIWELFARERI